MEPLEPPTGRTARLALVAFALLALLAIVAFASRSGLGHTSRAEPTPGYVSYAFTAFLILFVLAIPVAVWAFFMQAREGGFQRKSFRARVIQNLLTMIFILLLIIVVLYIRRHHGHIFGNNNSSLQKARDALKNAHAGQKPAKYAPQFQWLVFWIAVAGLAALTTVFFITRRRQKRRRGLPVPLPTIAEDLAASMSDAIEDLEAEPDARAAVIAAYARMERVFARHGLRRRPSETPLEYLRRILLGLTGQADAVARLTSLFEQAKFSRHDIDTGMKQDAIGALREIRDDLQGAPA
jgi:uncharacterized protein DUF4129